MCTKLHSGLDCFNKDNFSVLNNEFAENHRGIPSFIELVATTLLHYFYVIRLFYSITHMSLSMSQTGIGVPSILDAPDGVSLLIALTRNIKYLLAAHFLLINRRACLIPTVHYQEK